MDLIRKYFPDLSSDQFEKFELLGVLFPEWNKKINLISRKDMDHLYERHILHSLGIFKFCHFNRGSSIMDVGTGGGFPGIPLAIVNPEAKFTLVDSVSKKIMVVKDITQKCDIQNIVAINTRAENIPGSFNFIVSRAVTNFPSFFSLIRNKIDLKSSQKLKNGILYLKGGEFQEEIKPFAKRIEVINLSDYFSEEFFITKKLIYLPVNH